MPQGRRLLLALVVVLGLALALQAGLVAFAGYVVIGVYVLSRFLARAWISQLQVERRCRKGECEVGDKLEISISIRNTGAIPMAWLLVEDMVPAYALQEKPPRLQIKGRRIQVVFLRPRGRRVLKYTVIFLARGYYQLGPTFAETGDVFGLHRRHRLLSEPAFVMVLPRMRPLARYQFASERPIGEIRLANRLFEDPTRTAGVRPYMVGDPLQRVHWRATARTGELHCRVYEPTSLAGATILIDFNAEGFPRRGEPHRSELCITTACSLAYAVSLLNQQLGFASNGRDAAERIKAEAVQSEHTTADVDAETRFVDARTRFAVRDPFEAADNSERLRPVVVDTRRGFDQFQQIREALARLEKTEAMSFSQLVLEVAPRMPRDATVLAILPQVPVETAVALGHLRRQGFAVSALLIGLSEETDERPIAHGRLLSEGIRDVRFVNSEDDLLQLGSSAPAGASVYNIAVELA